MTSKEVRQQFLDFFASKQHKIVPSAPVVPFDDPTLLFTNAGMNQFKDVFLATGSRNYKRAADTQKCIRVSGKHNDLEEVGHDTYHHTFFEMLGNWSFGDYYKKEAIRWAWELLTEVWKLPKERLFATIYRADDEAMELWKSETDIKHEHILRFDEEDNFWEMGETGPCGPCSEIHINLSDNYEDPSLVNAGSPLCIEIWNLVFIQYNRDEHGKLHDLPAKHVDTGMGFERVCAVIQNKKSNYDTDVFTPLINEISKLSGIKYEKAEDSIAMRVIADHIRTLTFAIGDGAMPGNEGRGYVLRRILRRAARYGRKLNLTKPFFYKLVDVLVSTMGDVFPEIAEKKDYIKKVIKAEEENFNATLDRGIDLFDDIITRLKNENKKVIPGKEVFRLYDTFGFPVDLTNVMAQEQGFTIDEKVFDNLMDEQKNRAREASKNKFASIAINENDLSSFNIDDENPTLFTGYNELSTTAKVLGFKHEEEAALIILDRTPFYVEAGGQIDDHGEITINGKVYDVVDVVKIENKVIHVVFGSGINLNKNDEVKIEVDSERRWDIMRNHSATHFLHKALRTVLGTHVQQAGSYVGPDRLRFDFTHFSKMSEKEILLTEKIVNEQLRKNISLDHHRNIPFDDAKKMGAMMFFGDKYGDEVNVVQFGDFTMEFCGGTHVQNSSQIGLFKILSEASIASGVRRIEAVTGAGTENYIYEQLEKIKLQDEKVNLLLDEKRHLEKEVASLKFKAKLGQINFILNQKEDINGLPVYKAEVDADNMDELKAFGDELRNRMKSGIGILFAKIEDKAVVIAVVSDDLVKEKKLSAGKIVGDIAKMLGGGGGGRPHLATAGGKDVAGIPAALENVEEVVKKYL
ncbi:MAG: alanine--tRNA ligase [Ignavibacteria bacterium CG_4_9_14_3_um_filter_36_18]|nr:alanine--tRNA ligase [Ignavibacteria bacterium]PJB01029.1 MAG: alanine--tRNA ligase [Ignavibacteria bacterium CG_4_9_14_3_um_filter_36_18]